MIFYSLQFPEKCPPEALLVETEPQEQYLTYQNEAYFLVDGQKRHQALTIDFKSAFYRARGGTEYLPRSFRGITEIADATAGWARDAYLLAYRGFQIKIYERNPYLAFLLKEALQKDKNNPVSQRILLIQGDSSEILQESEAIYLDPMFPERKKSAKVGQEMQALQLLNPDDKEFNESALLTKALQMAKKRVVVKRPQGAPNIANHRPDYQINAPNTRYDVYQIF